MKRELAVKRTLKQRAQGTGHHYATEYGEIAGVPYELVRGTVRHSEGDHGMSKLRTPDGYKGWFVAVESNHVQSWGASGKVD